MKTSTNVFQTASLKACAWLQVRLFTGFVLFLFSWSGALLAADGHTVRARDLGIPFTGNPGPLNAITDVAGVEVGQKTLDEDIPGPGGTRTVRTGVTAIFPHGRNGKGFVFGGSFALNGTGEMTGKALIDEMGLIAGPIMLTGTASVGVVRDAVIEWYRDRLGENNPSLFQYILPVVAETYDGHLNQIYGFNVTKQDAFDAMNQARSGPVAEGNVGGGTGMIAFTFKGGIGTASRRLGDEDGGYTVGVLVQANFGVRRQLMIAGVPVGTEITGYQPVRHKVKDGSIIVVIATDAPLLPHQLVRLAKRATHGIARTGGMSGNTSGDIFVAFTTASTKLESETLLDYTFVNPWRLNPLLEATVLATEEAIINALVAARTMEGVSGNKVYALPHDRLREVMKKYRRLND
jgi:L-aminopeptidase/D-esterase-like protein